MASKLKAKAPEPVSTGKSKILVFGPTNSGKTWFGLGFPKPFYFDTERGARLGHYQAKLKAVGGGYMGPEDGTLEFDTLIEQIDALATEKHEYQTLVIDSLTKLYQTAIQKESEALGIKDVFGASKKPVVRQMRRLIARIDRLDMNVVFIAHEAAEYGTVDGKREEIGKMPDTWEKLAYELDLTLRIQVPNPKLRTATVYKTRLMGFPTGDRFDLMRGTEDVGYAEFASRYGKDFLEAPVKQIQLASAEQVSEIKRLLDIIKVSDDDIEKVFTKAGVESWEEMTTTQAGEMIARIKKKAEVPA